MPQAFGETLRPGLWFSCSGLVGLMVWQQQGQLCQEEHTWGPEQPYLLFLGPGRTRSIVNLEVTRAPNLDPGDEWVGVTQKQPEAIP